MKNTTKNQKRRKSVKKYNNSQKGKEARIRYRKSQKGKDSIIRDRNKQSAESYANMILASMGREEFKKNNTSLEGSRQISDSELDSYFARAIASLEREGFVFSDERQTTTSDEAEKTLEREQVESFTGQAKNFSDDMLFDEENLELC